MKKTYAIFIGLWAFHFIFSAVIFMIANSSFMAGYHNGQGLWNFAFDSFSYHEKAMESFEVLQKGQFTTWWETSFYRHTKYIGLLYYLLYPSPLSFAPVNGIVWAASIILIYRATMIIGKDNQELSSIVALLFGLWPSNLLHSTQLLRDPFYNFGILMILLGWVAMFHGHRRIIYSLIVSFGVILCIQIRPEPFWLLIFVSLLAASITAFQDRREAPYALLALIILALFYGYPTMVANANVNKTETSQNSKELVSENGDQIEKVKEKIRLRLGAEATSKLDEKISKWFVSPEFKDWSFKKKKSSLLALAEVHGKKLDAFLSKWMTPWKSTLFLPENIERLIIKANGYRNGFLVWYVAPGASAIDNDIIFKSVSDIINYVPRALMIGFFAPFPNQWLETGQTGGKAIRILGGIEMLACYALMVGFIAFLVASPTPTWCKVWLVLFMIIMILPLGLFVPNLGTLYRMRFICMTPILIGGAIGIDIVLRAMGLYRTRYFSRTP